MRWLRFVGSLKLQVSFAKEPYKRDGILPKRLIILKSLLIVATPYTFVGLIHCFVEFIIFWKNTQDHPTHVVLCPQYFTETVTFFRHFSWIDQLFCWIDPFLKHSSRTRERIANSLALSPQYFGQTVTFFLQFCWIHTIVLLNSSLFFGCGTDGTRRGGGLGSIPIFKKFNEPYAPS